MTGKPESLKTIVPERAGHDRRYLLDSSKLRGELSWQPEVSFEDGLRATVEWYATHRDWWEPLRGRAPVPGDREESQRSGATAWCLGLAKPTKRPGSLRTLADGRAAGAPLPSLKG